MSSIGKSFLHSHEDPNGEWKRLVSDAAYYLAKKRHFVPGSEIDDWLSAEEQVEVELEKRRLANSGSP